MRDDQRAFNTLVKQYSPDWPVPWTDKLVIGQAKGDTGTIRFGVLPFKVIPRYCNDDWNARPDLHNRTGMRRVDVLYPKAVIVHCLSQKTGNAKREFIKAFLD
jgi:hypothetical protein